MITHKNIDKILCASLALLILVTVIFINGENFGISAYDGVAAAAEYEDKIFDTSEVHTIDIIMDDWEGFIETCENEEYALCTVIIDGEEYPNVAIRAKGNTSLSSVAAYGNDRYSFKIEFDHYSDSFNYYGLDKLCLNNIIQDNTYMKDYLAYTLMGEFGVSSPLCSYVNVSVNGEVFGLYLAVEGVEESFLERNYGTGYGELYKPDSMSFGGGRGNGMDFDMSEITEMFGNGNFPTEDFNMEDFNVEDIPGNFGGGNFSPEDFMNGNFGGGERQDGSHGQQLSAPQGGNSQGRGGMPGGFNMENMPEGMEGFDMSNMPQMPEGFDMGSIPGGMEGFDMGNMPASPDGEDPAGNDTSGDGSGNFGGDGFSPQGGFNMGGFGGFGGLGGNDVSLIYTDDDYDSYSNIFDSAKTNVTDSDKDRLISSLKQLNANENIEEVVNVEDVIRYFVVHNYLLNFDSYTGSIIHNYYLYEKDGMMSMIPWDYNLAFGSFMSSSDAEGMINYPIDSPTSSGSTDSLPMIDWIFENEEYLEMYHEYFSEFIEKYFDSGYVSDEIKRIKELISPYVEEDPTKFCTYEEYTEAVSELETIVVKRAESISLQLDGVIPATKEGQSADKSSFVSADGIDLSKTGSMGMGGGFGGRGPNNTDTGNQVPDRMPSSSSSSSDNSGSGQQGMSQRPGMSGGKQSSQGGLLIISIVTLAVALLVVSKYKKY